MTLILTSSASCLVGLDHRDNAILHSLITHAECCHANSWHFKGAAYGMLSPGICPSVAIHLGDTERLHSPLPSVCDRLLISVTLICKAYSNAYQYLIIIIQVFKYSQSSLKKNNQQNTFPVNYKKLFTTNFLSSLTLLYPKEWSVHPVDPIHQNNHTTAP